MPADLSKLIVEAESATAERIVDETTPIFDAVGELGRLGYITGEAHREAVRIVRLVNRREIDRSCLLGAALLVVPEGLHWTAGDELGTFSGDQRPWVNLWRGHKLASSGRGASSALAFLAASLRALQAAAGATGDTNG